MNAKFVSVLAAASLLAVSVPAFASVDTRSSDAMPTAHSRYDDAAKKAEKAGRKAGRTGETEGSAGAGGSGGISTGVLAGLAGVLGAVGIAVAVQNRSN